VAETGCSSSRKLSDSCDRTAAHPDICDNEWGRQDDDCKPGGHPDLQADLLTQANQSGLSLEAYVEQLLRQRIHAVSGSVKARSQLAGQRIRELRKGVTLGGIPIKQLIEEGRE